MKGLALESVVKWIILLVVATVIIHLVLFFSDRIKEFIKDYMSKEPEIKTEVVEATGFTTSEVMTYVRSCWDKTGERFNGNVVCYVLKGDMSNVDASLLPNAVEPPAVVDVSKFDASKNFTIIRFEDVGNRIILES